MGIPVRFYCANHEKMYEMVPERGTGSLKCRLDDREVAIELMENRCSNYISGMMADMIVRSINQMIVQTELEEDGAILYLTNHRFTFGGVSIEVFEHNAYEVKVKVRNSRLWENIIPICAHHPGERVVLQLDAGKSPFYYCPVCRKTKKTAENKIGIKPYSMMVNKMLNLMIAARSKGMEEDFTGETFQIQNIHFYVLGHDDQGRPYVEVENMLE